MLIKVHLDWQQASVISKKMMTCLFMKVTMLSVYAHTLVHTYCATHTTCAYSTHTHLLILMECQCYHENNKQMVGVPEDFKKASPKICIINTLHNNCVAHLTNSSDEVTIRNSTITIIWPVTPAPVM